MSRQPQFPQNFQDFDFQHAARHAKDNRECVRLLGLAFLQQNRTVSEVAALLDVSNDAVHAWLYKFISGGLEAMRDQGGRGRKTLIPEDRYEEFKDAVLLAQQQKKGGRIVGRDIQLLLEKQFHVHCDLRTVYKLLDRVNLSWISGRSKHPKKNLEDQDTFKKTLLKT